VQAVCCLGKRPPLFYHPGARLHTLRITGCGSEMDGVWLLDLINPRFYAEGADRSGAVSLLQTVEVLQVEVGGRCSKG